MVGKVWLLRQTIFDDRRSSGPQHRSQSSEEMGANLVQVGTIRFLVLTLSPRSIESISSLKFGRLTTKCCKEICNSRETSVSVNFVILSLFPLLMLAPVRHFQILVPQINKDHGSTPLGRHLTQGEAEELTPAAYPLQPDQSQADEANRLKLYGSSSRSSRYGHSLIQQ